MERYTFDEIKLFQYGDIFWARNEEFTVNSDITYKNESFFYGDYSETIEWSAVSKKTTRQSKFHVSNVRENNASDPLIFKTPTREIPPTFF